MSDLPTDVRAVVDHAAEQGHDSITYLDPRNSQEEGAIKHFLDRTGKGKKRYPALHGALTDGGVALPDGPVDTCTLVDAGETVDGKATARTWACGGRGGFISGVHTMLLDPSSGSVLAAGSHTSVDGTFVQNATLDDGADATPQMTAVSFFHTQNSTGEPPRFGLAAQQVAVGPGVNIQVSEPKQTKGKKAGYVVIGVARDPNHQNPDCDYVYPSAQNVEPDRLPVPFVGSVEWPWPVTLPPNKVQSGIWCAGLSLPLGLYDKSFNPGAYFTQPQNNTFAWSFPYENKPLTEANSLMYEALPDADQNTTSFLMQITAVAGATREIATICSTDWKPKPSKNCKLIYDLEYWWHCIEGGAQVTLPGGGTKKLEEIENPNQVVQLDGTAAEVEATILDYHDEDSADPVFELKTSGGRSLVLSAWHPVLVGGQPVTVEDLKVGEAITVEGRRTEAVTSCKPVAYKGAFCNLQLAGGGMQGFFANGIAVGDFTALTDHQQAIHHDPDYMLARLPESHHTDFLSALSDATSR